MSRMEFMRLSADVRTGIASPGQLARWAEEIDRRAEVARVEAEWSRVGDRFAQPGRRFSS